MLIVGSGMTYHNMRGFGAPGAHADSVAFDDRLTSACTAEPARRREALAHWPDAPRARAAHPREEHLLPLMVVAGASDESGTRGFSDEVLGARVSAHRVGRDG